MKQIFVFYRVKFRFWFDSIQFNPRGKEREENAGLVGEEIGAEQGFG